MILNVLARTGSTWKYGDSDLAHGSKCLNHLLRLSHQEHPNDNSSNIIEELSCYHNVYVMWTDVIYDLRSIFPVMVTAFPLGVLYNTLSLDLTLYYQLYKWVPAV